MVVSLQQQGCVRSSARQSFKKSKILSLAVLPLALGFFASSVHADSFALKRGAVVSVKVKGQKTLCGLRSGRGAKWTVVKQVGRKKYAVDGRANSAKRKACAGLLARGKIKTLSDLPDDGSLVRVRTKAKGKSSENSGLPPAVIDINDFGIGIFWKEGVIEGLRSDPADATQCGEFFQGSDPEDGITSAGFEGCTAVEDLGYAFEPVLRSGSNLCYVKNLPQQGNLDSGALTVASGDLPEGKIENVFTAPSGSAPRLVKVQFQSSGNVTRSAFVEVAGADTNLANGDHYAYRFWSCGKPSESQPVAVLVRESAAVKLDGSLQVDRAGNDTYGQFDASSKGRLKVEQGSLEFDPEVKRTADVRYLSISGLNRFKAALEVSGNGRISERFLNLYRGRLSQKASIAEVSGQSLADLRVLRAAYKDQLTEESSVVRNFLGALKFDGSYYYRSEKNSDLLSEVQDVDLNGEFFSAIGDVAFDPSDLSCDAVADIVLTLDLENESAEDLVEACNDQSKQIPNFCRENGSILNILESYPLTCEAQA